MKKSLLSLLLALCVLLCGTAGWAEDAPMTGVYHDVNDGVSRLRVLPEGDGYAVTLDIYRLVSLVFTANDEGGTLRGTDHMDENMGEPIDIELTPAKDGGVRVLIVNSQWGLLEAGTVFDFAPGAPDMDSETFAWVFETYCTGIAGTAGGSLKLAEAASILLNTVIAGDTAYCDADRLTACMREATETLDAERRAELTENLSGIVDLVRGAFEDYDALRPTFEDAGVNEAMALAVASPLARDDWEAFCAAWTQLSSTDTAAH